MIKLTKPQSERIVSKLKYPLFLAGFGAGKSSTAAIAAINDIAYPGADVAVYAPSYDLLNMVMLPYIEDVLTQGNIPYKINQQKRYLQIEKAGKIFYRSMDNPAKIVGYEVFRSHIDELDTIDIKKASECWQKILGRNRQKVYVYDEKGNKIPDKIVNGEQTYKTYQNRIAAYTTPEGFRFCYERWEKNPKPGYGIIRASTYSNAHNLPEDYIPNLKASYPPELIEAYLEGRFVNLRSGRCYPGFDRFLNGSNETANAHDTLLVGMDFNVMHGAAIVHVIRDNFVIAVDEIHNAYDTDDQIRILKERYPNNKIEVYPDASSKNRTSSNTTEVDLTKLYNAGFVVKVGYKNPPIKDRVFSLSALILNANGERRYLVNVEKCPQFTLCLEQQVWDDNGLPDKSQGLDHKTDAAGYFVYERFPIQRERTQTKIITGNY